MSQDNNDDLMLINQLLKTGSDIFKTSATIDYNQQKIEATNNMANANLLAQMETNKLIGNARVKKDMITKELTETKGEIEGIKNNMAGYDVNYMEYFNLKDKDKGPFGQKVLDDIGVRYGENLAYSAEIADDSQTQLNNNEELLNLNYDIRDELQRKYNDIIGLQDDYLKVRDDNIYKGVSRMKEHLDYIDKNPETFAMKDEQGNIMYDTMLDVEGNEVQGDFKRNPLADAFVSKRGTVSSGGVPKDFGYLEPYTSNQMKAAGYNIKTGRKVIDETKEELNQNFNAGFANLNKAIMDTKGADADVINEIKNQSKWLKKYNVDTIASLSGAKDLWENPDNAMNVQKQLEEALINIFDDATTYTFGDQEEVRRMFALEDEKGNNTVSSTLANPKLRNVIIQKMYDRYLSDVDIQRTNIETGDTYVSKEDKPSTSGNVRLNKEYETDKIYHTSYMDKPDNFGGSPHDDVVHDLLYLWNQLNTAFPTAK